MTDRKPYWLTEPCPAWCDQRHFDRDMPGQRHHFGRERLLPLTQEPALPGSVDRPNVFRAPDLFTGLVQHHRETEPVVRLAYSENFEMRLTLDEVEQLAADLTALIADARGCAS